MAYLNQVSTDLFIKLNSGFFSGRSKKLQLLLSTPDLTKNFGSTSTPAPSQTEINSDYDISGCRTVLNCV